METNTFKEKINEFWRKHKKKILIGSLGLFVAYEGAKKGAEKGVKNSFDVTEMNIHIYENGEEVKRIK